jgi:N-acetylmuramoyl-L-alanine amidase
MKILLLLWLGLALSVPGAYGASLNRVKTLVLDAGHGGSDFGARSQSLSLEKDVTLNLVQEIQKRANSHDFQLRVIFTRSEDVFLNADDRVLTANRNEGDLFLSLHTCSGFQTHRHGIRIYRFSGEGEDPGGEGTTWDTVPIRFAGASAALAGILKEHFTRAFPDKETEIVSADLVQFHGLHMPAVMIEPLCLSNPEDDLKLNDRFFLATVAQAVVDSLIEYDGVQTSE